MLDLGLLQFERTCGISARNQPKRVKGTAGVQAGFGVGGGVAVEFNATHEDGVGNGQLVDVKGEVEVGVLGLGILQANGVLPSDAGGGLGGEDTQGAEHGPASVDEFALAEALETKDLGVGGKGIGGDLVSGDLERANEATSLVDALVLVEGVNIVLQVLGGLGETKRVEAAVTGEGAIEPIGAGGVGEPEGLACKVDGIVSDQGWRRGGNG